MSYFKPRQEQEPEPEQLFVQPVDLYADDEDDLPPDYDPDAVDEEEERRVGNLKVAAGVGDFLGVVLGTAVILLLVIVLLSLFNWLGADLGAFVQLFTH